jgi:pheromone shutdown-related protein TraB
MNDKLNSEMIHHLDHDGKRIILVGTAHVSSESVDLVEAVIADVKPDTVCVELCESRAQAIRQKDRWQEMDIIKVIKEKKAFLLLSNLMLASFQKRIANRLEVSPGQEMIQAMNSALAVGAVVHLADRDIRTTLSRTWRNMGLWGKIKLIFQLILSFGEVDEISEVDVEKMKQQDMLRPSWMRSANPCPRCVPASSTNVTDTWWKRSAPHPDRPLWLSSAPVTCRE